MTLIKKTVLFSAILGGLLSANVNAKSLEELFNMPLEQLLQVNVLGVSKKQESLNATPASVSVFDQAAIRRLGATTLVDLVPYATGFQVFRSGDSNQPVLSVRGRVTASSNREILMLIDGVRQDSWRTGGSIYNMPYVPLIGIEKVEFIRGAVSHIYGANAFLGVINITTQKPASETNYNEFELFSGTDLDYRAGYNWQKKSGRFTHAVIADLAKDRGQNYVVQNTFGEGTIELSDPYESYSFLYSPSYKGLSLSVSQRHYEHEHFFLNNNTSQQYSESEHTISTLSLSQEINLYESLNAQLDLGFTKNKTLSVAQITAEGQLFPISSPASNDPGIVRLDLRDQSYWARLDGRYQFRELVSYLFELEYRNQELEQGRAYNNYDGAAFAASEFPVTYYGDFDQFTEVTPKANDEVFGFLNQVEYQKDKLHVNLGFRYDYSSLAKENTSPRFSIVYEASQHQSIKAIYSEAFRPPNGNEFFVRNNPLFSGSVDLKAETVKTSELIWFYQKNQNRLQFGFYENQFENEIGVVLTNSGRREFANIGDSRARGFEAEITYPLINGVALNLSYSNVFDKPDDMYRLADDNGTLVFNHNMEGFNTNVELEYVGERAYLNSQTSEVTDIDSYVLLNAFFAANINNWEFSAKLDNLLDKDYFSPSFGESLQAIPARGRSLTLGIRHNF